MSVHTLNVNFTRGEVTPYVHARVDAELYQSAVAVARNFLVLRYGGLTKAPGTLFYGAARFSGAKTRFLPFKFNATQVYAIEAGDQYFRFWTVNGRVESPPGTPVTVGTPYQEADLPNLQVRQSGDVIYIWCRGYQPRLLTRLSETSWTLTEYTTQDGPYLPVDTRGTTLTLSSTNHITTAGTPSGSASAANAFDHDLSTNADGGGSVLSLVWEHSVPAKVPTAYWLAAAANAASQDMPTIWTLEGSNDGINFAVLDSRQGESGWAPGEKRFYEFSNENAYAFLRIQFSGGGGDDATPTVVAEVAIAEWGDTMDVKTLTASSTAGINGGAGFMNTDVGRPIRILGGDGKWRWLKITGFTSTTQVSVRVYGHTLPDTRPIAVWRLGAWADSVGWPAAGAIYEDRLTHANSPTDPIAVWSGVNADYDNFRVSDPLVADDAVTAKLTGGELNQIIWMVEGRDILAGTAGSLRTVGRNNTGEAYGPTNVRQRSETIVGVAQAAPLQIENMIIFLDFYETRLYEAGFTYEVEGYIARELSALNEHLFGVGVDQIAFQSHPHRIIWGRRKDGKLVAATYDRDQKVFGVSLVDVGGEVESIMALNGTGMTDIWLSVKRPFGAGFARNIERMAPFYRTDLSDTLPVYAACALTYSGAATDTVTGADHLNGMTVGIWANGRDLGDVLVTGGELTLPGEFTAEEIVIGLRMPGRIEGLRLEQIGNQDGTGLGRKVNILSARVDIYDTGAFKVGSLNEVNDMVWEDDSENDPYDPHPLRTGMYPIEVNDSWRNNGVFAIEADSMYPVTIRAVSLEIEGEP